MPTMRLPNIAHTSRPWRIHELTRDFRLEDVWALPTAGDQHDFARLVRLIASGDPSRGSSRAARTLWATQWKLGQLLGWDRPGAGLGSRVPTLRSRLPADLREGPSGPDFDALPFSSLYLLTDGWAAEIANRTMHGVMHLGWVPDEAGGYRGQTQIAETTLGGRRLVVRRVRTLDRQGELLPSWELFPFATNRTDALATVEAEHRQHAVVELAIRDLKDQALAHFPPAASTPTRPGPSSPAWPTTCCAGPRCWACPATPSAPPARCAAGCSPCPAG
jgi:hypothetical protein